MLLSFCYLITVHFWFRLQGASAPRACAACSFGSRLLVLFYKLCTSAHPSCKSYVHLLVIHVLAPGLLRKLLAAAWG